MAKSAKLPDHEVKRALLDELEKHDTTWMTNITIIDRAYWLTDDYGHIAAARWILACELIDRRNDKGPLLELLKSEFELCSKGRKYLVDLLERHNFRKKRGRPATPAYELPEKEGAVELAVEEVRNLVRRPKASTVNSKRDRLSVRDALERVSKSENISIEKLALANRGRRGSARRLKKRRP